MPEPEVRRDDTGAAMAVPGRISIDLPELQEAGDLDVHGHALDDEPGTVEVTAAVDGARLVVSFDPTDAREFAERVAEAARFAEEGQ